jgi:hypothetical protein
MSLIDDALKRAQAMDRVAGDRPSTWTPTHLPDRRPRPHRAMGIAAGLLGIILLALWAWKSLPKREIAVKAAPVPVAAAAPGPRVADIPAADTVEVAPPPRGVSEPKTSAAVVPDRPLKERPPVKATSASTQAEAAPQAKPAEEPRPAPAKREASAHAEDKLADGRKYTGEILLGDNQKITLDGIVYSDENPVALINGMVIAPGQAVDGMTVAKIEPDRVVLEGRGVTVFLQLK